MGSKVGFVSMGASAGAGKKVPEVGIGAMGYAFMGKAHANAYKKIPYIYWPPPAIPKLVSICGRNEGAVAEAAKRFGYEKYCTDWRELISDDRVQVLDNGTPNDQHAEPCIAAAKAGKHVICEKPLGRNAQESKRMLDAVKKAGVKHSCAFNYRFVPAVRQAYDLIKSGKIGKIFHFRAKYLQEWIIDPNFPMIWRLDRKVAGSGALGDLGAHIIDLARFLVGDIKTVSAITATFVKERPIAGTKKKGKVTVDDAFESAVEFANGAIGTLEASRFCAGRKNGNTFEVNGSKGSIVFSLERMNELQVYYNSETPKETQGFHDVLISESYHPHWDVWWPHGHIIGWEHSFVHELKHFLEAVVNNKKVEPYGATFEDGYRCAVVCDGILESAKTGRRVTLKY